MGNYVKSLLTRGELREVADAIAQAEQSTSGEIRVVVRQRRSRRDQTVPVEELARREFHQLGMTRTAERNGILLLLLLEDRELHILADEGIHQKVDPSTWQQIADRTASEFGKRNFRAGLIDAVGAVGSILAQHFPRKPNDVNELPNEVRIQ